ncbi:MAG: AAA family ATPase [Anaerolineaceae bacterium]|nr:AAA family ATPase [Anaerolineaceae bacterium]
MAIRVPVGHEFFDEIIKNGAYYVDKTELLYELLDKSEDKVALITRPRRFGKSLNMSMIQSFLDIRKDSKELFKGLAISKHEAFCKEWMNQYPVIFITLKDVEGLTFQSAMEMLHIIIAEAARSYRYLGESDKPDQADKDDFTKLINKTANTKELQNSLKTITRMMTAYYGKEAILLIDEYDVPLAKARENGYYREMLEVIRGLMSSALKSNTALKFSVVTGCLRIAKESIFTGVNNFKSYSVLNEKLSRYFGFTQEEIDDLLEKSNLTEKKELIRSWYDGYIFGNTPVYCPWDVVNYVSDLLYDPDEEPRNYWKNTSGNGILREFVENENFNVSGKFETLLNGGTITQTISDELTYETLKLTEDNFWSVLLMTGYLTKADPNEKGRTVALKIPNLEVATIFEETVISFFADTVDTQRLTNLMNALWSGDEETASEIFSDLLFDTISYMDYHEDYYHAFLAGLFVGRGFEVYSNKERGKGRPDILLLDKKNRRALVIEAKKSASETQMQSDCEKALQQIETLDYAKNVKGYRQIMTYGIAFFEKTALVKGARAL